MCHLGYGDFAVVVRADGCSEVPEMSGDHALAGRTMRPLVPQYFLPGGPNLLGREAREGAADRTLHSRKSNLKNFSHF